MSSKFGEERTRRRGKVVPIKPVDGGIARNDPPTLAQLSTKLQCWGSAPTPDPEVAWARLKESLPDLHATRRRSIHHVVRRSVAAAAVAALLMTGLAFASEPVRQVLGNVYDAVATLLGVSSQTERRGAQEGTQRTHGTQAHGTPTLPGRPVGTGPDARKDGRPPAKQWGDVVYGSKTSSPPPAITVSTSTAPSESGGSAPPVPSPVNQAPVAHDDEASTEQGTAVTIPVLANDTDPEGAPLHVAAVGDPAVGTVAAGQDSVTYTPPLDFTGTTTFTYTASDGSQDSEPATVTVTVR
jgi:Bacterial Ig domain